MKIILEKIEFNKMISKINIDLQKSEALRGMLANRLSIVTQETILLNFKIIKVIASIRHIFTNISFITFDTFINEYLQYLLLFWVA